jgi:hypothetical protein
MEGAAKNNREKNKNKAVMHLTKAEPPLSKLVQKIPYIVTSVNQISSNPKIANAKNRLKLMMFINRRHF